MLSSSFNAIGKLEFKEKPELKVIDSKKSLWKGLSTRVKIKSGENTFYVDFFGGDMYKDGNKTHMDDLFYYNNDGEKVYVSDESKESLKDVPSYKKMRFNDKEFLSGTHFVQEVYDNLDSLNGKTVYISGQINFQYGSKNDAIYKSFVVNSIYLAENQDSEHRFNGQLQLFFADGAIDTSIFKGKNEFNIPLLNELGNKIKINGYVAQYNRDKDTRDSMQYVYYPLETTIDVSKLDLTNDKHKSLLMFMLKQCAVGNSKQIVSSGWKVKFVQGSQNVELTEAEKRSLLNPEEIQYIALFPDEEQKFLNKKLNKVSEFVEETKLISPHPSMPIKEVQEGLSLDMLELYRTIGQSESRDTTETTIEATSAEPNFENFFA